jgi:anti-anti-sigma factor
MDDEIVSFRREDRPEGVCLVVVGEIDLADISAFHDASYALVEDASSAAIIDLGRVTFFNSSGISALIAAQQRANHCRVRLIIEASPNVRRVLEVTGLTHTFELCDPQVSETRHRQQDPPAGPLFESVRPRAGRRLSSPR